MTGEGPLWAAGQVRGPGHRLSLAPGLSRHLGLLSPLLEATKAFYCRHSSEGDERTEI